MIKLYTESGHGGNLWQHNKRHIWQTQSKHHSHVQFSVDTLVSIYLAIGFHIVTFMFKFWGNGNTFSKVAALFSSNSWEFQFCKSSSILFIIYWIIAIPTDVKWYLTGVLVGISLVANDVEHALMGLLTICKLTIEKYLLRSFAQFLIWSFIFLFSFKCSLYILNTTLLPKIYLLIVLSPFWVVFSLSWWYHLSHKCFNFSVIWIFCFFCFCFYFFFPTVTCTFSIINA